MRLGQLARKYDLTVQEVITFLESHPSFDDEVNANLKIDEFTKRQIFEHFDLEIEPVNEKEEVQEEIQEAVTDKGEAREKETQEAVTDEGEVREEETQEAVTDKGEVREEETQEAVTDIGEAREEEIQETVTDEGGAPEEETQEAVTDEGGAPEEETQEAVTDEGEVTREEKTSDDPTPEEVSDSPLLHEHYAEENAAQTTKEKMVVLEQKEELAAEARQEPLTPMEDIALVDGEINILPIKEEVETTALEDPEDFSSQPPKEDEIIQTDQLLELLESDETPPDLEKIKLIKAPKRELSGLKVLGKVELPEPKKKDEKEKPNQNKRGNKQELSEKEREKRRLKAKRKKEAYEARQEKRRREEEANRQKSLKEAHYKQKLEKAKVQQTRQKHKQQQATFETQKATKTRPKPKTVLGKFWRWLNT